MTLLQQLWQNYVFLIIFIIQSPSVLFSQIMSTNAICGNDNAVIKWWCTVHFYTWYFHCHISSLTYNTVPCYTAPHSCNNADAALNNIHLTHFLSIFIWIFRIDGCKDDCSSHGSCLDDLQICVCNSGWTGMACETALCPNNCSGNGSCINGKCLCNEQHKGRFIAYYFYCLSKYLSKIRLHYIDLLFLSNLQADQIDSFYKN